MDEAGRGLRVERPDAARVRQERGISLSNLRYWIYRLRKESRPLVTEAAKVLWSSP